MSTCYTGALRASTRRWFASSADELASVLREIGSAVAAAGVVQQQRNTTVYDFWGAAGTHEPTACSTRVFRAPQHRLVADALVAAAKALALVHVPAVLWGNAADVWSSTCNDGQTLTHVELFVPADHIVSEQHLQLIVVCADACFAR